MFCWNLGTRERHQKCRKQSRISPSGILPGSDETQQHLWKRYHFFIRRVVSGRTQHPSDPRGMAHWRGPVRSVTLSPFWEPHRPPEPAAVDGRSHNNDFLSVGQNTDHGGHGRGDFNEVISGFLDNSQNFIFCVLDGVGFPGYGDFHTVDVDRLLSGKNFNFLLGQQDSDDLLVSFHAGQHGKLVTARAIFGQDLIASREGSVVEKAIEGGDSLGANKTNTGGAAKTERDSHALGQDDFSDGVNFNSAEENIGVRLETLNIHRSSQWVVDTLDSELVLSVHNFDLVVSM
uniref:Uncharacterized protein n=1 Tax=Daphnia magna TaxID=35525 RepID=A0A0P4WH60_9CRUS